MSVPTSSLRQLMERLVTEAETFCEQAREKGEGEIGARLNQAVRRIRQTSSFQELENTLADTASDFADRAVIFHLTNGLAKASAFDVELPLTSAPALAEAVETRDPVIAVATPGEVSSMLTERFGHEAQDRVSIFPVSTFKTAHALLYCWGKTEGAPVELLTQVASAQWAALIPPEPPKTIAPDVTLIAPAPKPPAAQWNSLDPKGQQIHLRAQRFARVQVAAMRLNEAAAVQSGRSRGNLYMALRESMDDARAAFRKNYLSAYAGMTDYLHVELVRTLANDNAELLGKEYPGPMV